MHTLRLRGLLWNEGLFPEHARPSPPPHPSSLHFARPNVKTPTQLPDHPSDGLTPSEERPAVRGECPSDLLLIRDKPVYSCRGDAANLPFAKVFWASSVLPKTVSHDDAPEEVNQDVEWRVLFMLRKVFNNDFKRLD